MKDMIGDELNSGDLFLIPGGNPRFGGLVIEVGIILSKTEKMLKTYVTKFDKIKCRPLNKTPRKVLKITQPSETFLQHQAIKELTKIYEELNNRKT